MNRRQINWALCALLTLLLVSSICSLAASGPSAKKLYQQGQAAEVKDDPIGAYEYYYQAWQKEPKNYRYKTAYERLRFLSGSAHIEKGEKLMAQGDITAALTEFLRAIEIDPSNELAHQDIQKAREKLALPAPNQETSIPESKTSELSDVGSPIELKPISNEPLTLHMTEDSKVVYSTIGKAAGINVLFDPEYTSKRIQVDIANVSLFDALRIVATVSGTFWHAVTPNTIFVAMNTRAKRQELEEEAVQTFYLANTAQQNDLNDIQTALRNLLVNAKLYGVPSQSAIVMRATPDELLLAQKLINDLDKSRPEVVVDVALLEVNRDKTRTIGIQLPGTFGVQLQNSSANSTSTTSTTGTTSTTSTTSTATTTGTTTSGLTLNSLAHLNATNFAVTIGQATANLLLSASDTKVLQNPSIRATDGQKADLKIGERIPVATGSYQTGAATAVVSSLVNTQFTYLDVGVEIEITPIVHYDRDVTLKIKIVSSQEEGSTNIGGITEPIISQRTADQVVRLKEGEVNILGGFLQKQDLTTIGGTPGLGELPILKWIFSSTQHEVQDDEIIFMLTPHVVRATEITPLNLKEIDTGTGTNVELRRISAPSNQPQQPGGTGTLPPGLQPHAPAAAAGAEGNGPPSTAAPTPPPAVSSSVTLQIAPPATVPKAGSTFQVAVNLSGGQDVFSVPMQLHYDNTKLALINVDTGGFLGRDGQAIALVHRDDGVGNVVISASRPPGVAGVSGSGTVCVLTFQANAPGDAAMQVIRASVKNSAQQPVNIAGSQTAVHVQ